MNHILKIIIWVAVLACVVIMGHIAASLVDPFWWFTLGLLTGVLGLFFGAIAYDMLGLDNE